MCGRDPRCPAPTPARSSSGGDLARTAGRPRRSPSGLVVDLDPAGRRATLTRSPACRHGAERVPVPSGRSRDEDATEPAQHRRPTRLVHAAAPRRSRCPDQLRPRPVPSPALPSSHVASRSVRASLPSPPCHARAPAVAAGPSPRAGGPRCSTPRPPGGLARVAARPQERRADAALLLGQHEPREPGRPPRPGARALRIPQRRGRRAWSVLAVRRHRRRRRGAAGPWRPSSSRSRRTWWGRR
jgi:hypothetical protein